MALNGRRALFISYNGMLEPLGKSQVIPYLKELAARGVNVSLLSFERAPAFTKSGRTDCQALKDELAALGIHWYRLRYHKRFSIPATIFDVCAGIRCASRLVKCNRIEVVHARSHIPAAIAVAIKKRFGSRMIFDVRGLMAEEYLEAGHWSERSFAFRLSKILERLAFATADGVVTLTHKIWPVIKKWDGLREREVVHEVIPCCTDLKTFHFTSHARSMRRAELRLGDRFTIVYSGSIGGWYLLREMADFFVQLQGLRPDAHFMWLTNGDPKFIETIMRERHIEQSSYTIKGVTPLDVPSYLSAADAGIAFYKPGLSKLATSPVKVSEYFACGLPVIVNQGVGDLDLIVHKEKIGAVIRDFTPSQYAWAASQIESLARRSAETRESARWVAERYFDLQSIGGPRYARLYERVLKEQ